MDAIERLEKSTAHAAGIVRGVKDDHLSNQTPCSEFDVRALLNHLLAGVAMLTAAAQTGKGDRPDGDIVGPDPAALYEEGRAKLLEALRAEGVLQKQFEMPFGTMPAEMLVGVIAFPEYLVHAWDLAKATGQDATIPEALAQEALDALTPIDAMLRGPGVFGPKVDVPENAPITDRLVAFAGRQP